MNLDPVVVAILRRLILEHNIYNIEDIPAEQEGDIADLFFLQD